MAEKETYEEALRRMLKLQGMTDESVTAFLARKTERGEWNPFSAGRTPEECYKGSQKALAYAKEHGIISRTGETAEEVAQAFGFDLR